MEPDSRHAVLRFRFNAVKQAIGYDTLPKVMNLCFEGLPWKLDKQDWIVRLPNESEIWLGGLDEKERTEKILGQEFCVDPAARILTAGLVWKRADELQVGEELIAFPEDLDGHCKLHSSRVTRSNIIRAPKYKIITDKGETIVSAQHKFVAHYDDRRHRNYRQFSWRTADELSVGDQIRWTCKTWDEGHSKEDGWFAGMLDGEGWVSAPARQAGIAQNRGPILDALRAWLVENEVHFVEHENKPTKTNKICHQLRCGLWPALRLLGIAQPKRLDARKIWNDCRAFRSPGHDATIISIEKLGEGDVVALGTTTKTFIADGFLGHNCTLFLNECSQIAWTARNMAVTRVAQQNKLKQKVYYDCNPPPQSHWTYKLFIQGIDPTSKQPIPNVDMYKAMLMNPTDNMANLSEEYIQELEHLPDRLRRRFLLGQFLPENEQALWTTEMIEENRMQTGELPDLQRVVVAVDPSGADDDPDKNNDEIGICVVALGVDGEAYVLEDLTLKGGPAKWGNVAARAFDRHAADLVVGEANFGGAMVEFTIQTARPNTPYKGVTASRGKVVRAEPISALYSSGKVHHVGRFPALEDELLEFTTTGYMGTRSPNRADALIWGLTELFPGMTRKKLNKVLIEGQQGFNPLAW